MDVEKENVAQETPKEKLKKASDPKEIKLAENRPTRSTRQRVAASK